MLRLCMQARAEGRVFSIVFLGINGVGKSTNLAKVAYHLKHVRYVEELETAIFFCPCACFVLKHCAEKILSGVFVRQIRLFITPCDVCCSDLLMYV